MTEKSDDTIIPHSYSLASPFNFSYSLGRSIFRYICILLWVGCMMLSIFSDVLSFHDGEKTLWLIDTSLSMRTQDINATEDHMISRWDAIKTLISSGWMIESGQHGIMIFSDTERLILPFSTDTTVFASTLEWIQDELYGGTTDIMSAIDAVWLIYPHEKIRLVVLTDGEDTSQEAWFATGTNDTARSTFLDNMDIVFVGIGTEAWGPMLQWYDADGHPRYKQYHGSNAISKRDTAYISHLAELYDGSVFFVDSLDQIVGFQAAIQSDRFDIFHVVPRDILLFFGAFLLLAWLMVTPFKISRF